MTEALHQLAGRHTEGALQHARGTRRSVLMSLTVPISPPADLLALAHPAAANDGTLFFWQRPRDRFAVVGLGSALSLRARGAGRFRELAAACAGITREAVIAVEPGCPSDLPLFLGGFSFAPRAGRRDVWEGFEPARLTVPALCVTRRGASAYLTANVLVAPDSSTAAVERRAGQCLSLLRRGPAGAVRANGRAAAPPAAASVRGGRDWTAAVRDTLADIAAGRIDKLVLARSWSVCSERPFDCAHIVDRLRAHYPSCASFWIGNGDAGFLGATPEPLVHLSGGHVTTAALAGSTGRGAGAREDEALAEALRRSVKDRDEHAVVVRAIREALAPLCDELTAAPAPEVLRLENVQHLCTPIRGRLRERHDVLDLVERLHPSPSVAGYPRAAALDLLREREGLERGWYAGPVGWVNAALDGEFAVALRCALVRGNQARLFAGAGIVAGSDPEAEMAETRLKMQPLLAALGGA